MRVRQAARGVVPAVVVAAAVAASPPAAGAAVAAPSVTSAPSTGLADGQSVLLTATNLYGSEPGQGIPAYQCAGGQFPASLTFSASLQFAVTDAVNRFCTYLGQFATSTTATSSGSFLVHRSFESFNGSSHQCGSPNPDCVVLAVGTTNGSPAYGLASASIKFAAPK